MPQRPPKRAKNIEEIYAEESGSLRLSVRRLLSAADKRWDALHDVFARALGRDLGHVKEPKPFFMRAVRNQARDELRRRKRWTDREPLLANDQPSSRQPTPEEAYEGAELAERIERAMATLPAEQREALELVSLGELSFAEAAVRMGRREHKVRRLVSKALLRLQAALAAGSGDADE